MTGSHPKIVNIVCRDVDHELVSLGAVDHSHQRIEVQIHEAQAVTEAQHDSRRFLEHDEDVVRQLSAADALGADPNDCCVHDL